MAIVYQRSGTRSDPDDDKARAADAILRDLRAQLADAKFISRLPPGAKQRLEKSESEINFTLAIYRGELSKAARKGGGLAPVAATAMTRPATGTPADVIVALATAAVLAVAVLIVTSSRGVVFAGSKLEESLSKLSDTANDILPSVTIIELSFSPIISRDNFNKFIANGVITSGIVLAIDVGKLEDYVDGVFGVLNGINAIGSRQCAAQIAGLLSLAQQMKKLIEDIKQAITDKKSTAKILRQIADLLNLLGDAESALNECLLNANSGGSGGSGSPSNKPN